VPEKLTPMTTNNRTRLRKLCARAITEKDTHELAVLLMEIDDILSETVEEIAGMLKDVEQVLKKRERSSRIHLA
jgi:predicted component of type VI protein secretion system